MSNVLYDPPGGWCYGFPKIYLPREGETLRETLVRDGYPESLVDETVLNHTRFIGDRADLERIVGE